MSKQHQPADLEKTRVVLTPARLTPTIVFHNTLYYIIVIATVPCRNDNPTLYL